MCLRIPQLETQRGGAGPATGRQQGMGGDGAGANVPSACTSGPRGLALGGGSRPALHLLLPPPHPAGASPEEREQLVLFPRKVHTSTLCSGGQRGRVLAWASGPCAHTHLFQGPAAWQVWARDSHTHPNKPQRWPGTAGTHGRVQTSPGALRKAKQSLLTRRREREDPGESSRLGNCSARKIKDSTTRQSQLCKPCSSHSSALMRSGRHCGRQGGEALGGGKPRLVPCHPGDRPAPHRPAERVSKEPRATGIPGLRFGLTRMAQAGLRPRMRPARDTHGHTCGLCSRDQASCPEGPVAVTARPAHPVPAPQLGNSTGHLVLLLGARPDFFNGKANVVQSWASQLPR